MPDLRVEQGRNPEYDCEKCNNCPHRKRSEALTPEVFIHYSMLECKLCGKEFPSYAPYCDMWKTYKLGKWTLFKRKLGVTCADCVVKNNLPMDEV